MEKSSPYFPPLIPTRVADQPLAPDFESLLGLITTGTPVPLEERGKYIYPFEDNGLRAIILDRLRKGYPPKVCVQAVGVRFQTWKKWLKQGSRGIEPFATFAHEVACAQSEGAIGLLDTIRAAGEGAPDQHGVWKNKWEASRWLLERADPDTFMPVEKSISAHIDLPTPSNLDIRAMSEDDLLALDALLERAPVIDVDTDDTGP
jgi:hypothetical protein